MHKALNIENKTLFNILKLLGAVLILYFGWTLYVYNVGEKIDLGDESLQEISLTGLQGMTGELKDTIGKHNVSHNVSDGEVENMADGQTENLDGERNEYKMKFQRVCIANISMCSKISFEGSYDYKQKYMYLATAIYVLNNVEDNLQFGRSVLSQLDEIEINNEVGNRRGYATWDKIVINLGTVGSYVEFFELLSHEMGHIVDLGIVRGYSNVKSSIYTEFDKKVFSIDDPSIDFYSISWQSEKVRKSDAVREDFCSGYGMTDPFEDFAECHNMYLNHNAIFKKIAEENDNMRRKYNFMANLYGGKYFFNAREDLEKIKYDVGWRPWDTTRM